MKQLSKLWLDLCFCFILILSTSHTSNYFADNQEFSQPDISSKLVKLDVVENN